GPRPSADTVAAGKGFFVLEGEFDFRVGAGQSCPRLPRACSPCSRYGHDCRRREQRQARGRTRRRQIGRLLVRLRGVPLPPQLDGVWEELLLGVADAVAGPATEQVLVLVALGLQHL